MREGLERTGDGEYFSEKVVSRSAGERLGVEGRVARENCSCIHSIEPIKLKLKVESDINSDPHSAKPQMSSLS